MATGDTDVKICSDALTLLGSSRIVSFTDGTTAASVCHDLYPGVRDSALMSYRWRFAQKKVQLNQLVAAPTNEWQYAYQLPSDRLGHPVAAYRSANTGDSLFLDWELQGDQLLTNAPTVVIDYLYQVTEDAMPSYFVQLLKYLMAMHLAEPVTDQMSKSVWWKDVAVGPASENQRGGYFRQAMAMDAQGAPPYAITDYPLVDVR